MAQGEGFKHITVTAAEDEDVVIHAGLRDAKAPGGQADEASDSEAVSQSASDAEAVLPIESIEDGGKQAKPAKRPVRNDDGYRETTLDDLESSSMPFTQKVVIVAAIVCIIGALAYYFAFMR